MIKDSLTIITHSTTKMFVFKSLTNHNKEVILNTQHKTCQTYYLELINKNVEVFSPFRTLLCPNYSSSYLNFTCNYTKSVYGKHYRIIFIEYQKSEDRDGNTSKYHSLPSLIVVASNLA